MNRMLNYRQLEQLLAQQLPCIINDPSLQPQYSRLLARKKQEASVFSHNNRGKSLSSFEVTTISPSVKALFIELENEFHALYCEASVPLILG